MSLLNPEQGYPTASFMATPGFRLYKLEVLNWGTFDNKVWTFSPGRETALLTGDVGSGKSTLVDALTTLLVSPRKIAYNKSADSSAKERTITSYVRGYFGNKKDGEGRGRPDCLRDTGHYSVILATFRDQVLSQDVTLAQFFWFQDTQKPPARFYVVADREMWITKDFSRFELDIRVLKKRLKHNNGVQVLEEYIRYAEVFRRKLGIAQEQALDLFQQTISMKKVEALTEFVRANMLEIPNTAEDVKKLIGHFHDLNCAHEAVIKAKNQIQYLKPIADQGRRCEQLGNEQQVLNNARQALSPWFAEQTVVLLEKEIARLEHDLMLATAEREQAEVTQDKIEKSIKEIERAIYSNGGDALEELKRDIQSSKEALRRIHKDLSNYITQAEKLRLPEPVSLEVFINNRQGLPALKTTEEALQGRLDDDYATAKTEEKRADQELKQVSAELESLRARKTSIPREQIEKRKQLCQALHIAEEDLPFVGELLEVRGEDEDWEGAIERLLHNFALSLLVQENHYLSIAQWVDRMSLGMRLVYYRVHLDKVQPFSGQSNPLSVAEKLNIKPGTPFGAWLNKELHQRFAHVCCERIDQFHREQQAITKAGQIKTNGYRHEKDDRHGVGDRRRFVLGFSNQKKIDVLEEHERDVKEEARFYWDEAKKAKDLQRDSQERLNAINNLDNIADFKDLDISSVEKDIEEKEQRKNKLEQESNVLQGLQRQLEILENKKLIQAKVLESLKERDERGKRSRSCC